MSYVIAISSRQLGVFRAGLRDVARSLSRSMSVKIIGAARPRADVRDHVRSLANIEAFEQSRRERNALRRRHVA